MRCLDQSFQFVGGNHCNVTAFSAPNDHRLTVIADLVKERLQIRARVCVCGFNCHRLPSCTELLYIKFPPPPATPRTTPPAPTAGSSRSARSDSAASRSSSRPPSLPANPSSREGG